MLGIPSILKGTWDTLRKGRKVKKKNSKKVSGNKRFLIPKKELAREYCVKKEGTTTCHIYKYAKKDC